ncbi:hypothetical protein PLESTM_001491900 [Pleodorina starrii]|nr:hypothetical protein PLESTM_001491900 [Pleodorina starrii]
MESLNEQEAMRVLKAAAALDALRSTGSRSAALAPGRLPVPPPPPPPQQPPLADIPPSPTQALGEDVWREMTEMEGGEQKRHGDLDSWLDVFRATAGSVRNAWRSGEAPTFESLAFGWLALARKHESLQCAPPAGSATGEELTDTALLAGWLDEARWAQAAYRVAPPASSAAAAAAAAGAAAVAAPAAAPAAATAAEEGPASATAVEGGGEAGGAAAATAAAQDATAEGGEDGGAAATSGEEAQQLMGLLGLQPADVLACRLEPSGECPGFFLAVHHESRTVRLVIRGASSLPDLLNPAAAGGGASVLGSGFGHRGMLAAAQQLLGEAGGRMRAAMAAHPGYGLRCIGHSEGAGIAALLAVLLLSPEGGPGGGQPAEEMLGGGPGPGPGPGPEGEWRVRVRATCFGPPPVLTSELAERTAGCIDSVVYNADLWSRCSSASLRRLTGEMSAASQEVLARSELAQTLRRSGALGLANHLVAAALCRCQPPQDSPAGPLAPAPAPGPAAMLMGVPSRPHLAVPEGLAAPGSSLTRPPPVAATTTTTTAAVAAAALLAAAPTPALTAQPNGRAGQLATLGSPHKLASGVGGPPVLDPLSVGVAAASPLPMPPPPLAPLPPPAAPPAPLGPPTGTLPPLPAAVSSGAALGVGGAAAAAAARASGFESPHRRPPEAQGGPVGVLSPPPLVAAAAAAQHAAAVTVAAVVTAGGPTPPRRGLASFVTEGRDACVGRSYSDDGSGMLAGIPAAAATPAAVGVPLLEPLAVPPLLLPAGGAAVAAAGMSSPHPSAPRREVMAACDGAAGAVLPPLLPPLVLPTLVGPAAQPQSARLTRGQMAHFEAQEGSSPQLQQPLVPQPESGSERSMRGIQLLQLSDGSFTKHPQQQQQLQLPLPVPQLQQQPQQQAGQELERAWAEEGPELHVPGVVHLIERRGANANASFRLLRDVNRAHLARVLLKRSMLRDHLLSHYTAALERTMVQR